MDQILCWHKYGRPIGYEYTRHTGDFGEVWKITIRFTYQCQRCGKVKQGRRLSYITEELADKLIRK